MSSNGVKNMQQWMATRPTYNTSHTPANANSNGNRGYKVWPYKKQANGKSYYYKVKRAANGKWVRDTNNQKFYTKSANGKFTLSNYYHIGRTNEK